MPGIFEVSKKLNKYETNFQYFRQYSTLLI